MFKFLKKLFKKDKQHPYLVAYIWNVNDSLHYHWVMATNKHEAELAAAFEIKEYGIASHNNIVFVGCKRVRR